MATSTSNRREQLRRQQEAAERQKKTNRIIGLSAAAVALVLVGVLIFVLVQNMSGNRVGQMAPEGSADSIVLNSTPAPADAPTVTVYLDYQCPNCRVFEETYGDTLLTEANAGTWTLENKTMTFMDNNLQNTASTRAAVGAACSAVVAPETYPQYSMTVYGNQEAQEVRGSEGYSDTLLRDTIPAQVGITGDALTQFQACYDNDATSEFVTNVERSAYSDNVTGTPTIAVNGTIVDLRQLSDPSPEGLRAFLLANA
ncbi:DsbA family protein [Propioniciclava soli]|uniref:Thioredoxin domain-containing protein n=1 Tax=Propioniciclava soli TaxID=2775081 RepID=A0ABZ3C3E7_9ACTN|nr:thioredoxin domain-containing protein [Propioniciclava soli]